MPRLACLQVPQSSGIANLHVLEHVEEDAYTTFPCCTPPPRTTRQVDYCHFNETCPAVDGGFRADRVGGSDGQQPQRSRCPPRMLNATVAQYSQVGLHGLFKRRLPGFVCEDIRPSAQYLCKTWANYDQEQLDRQAYGNAGDLLLHLVNNIATKRAPWSTGEGGGEAAGVAVEWRTTWDWTGVPPPMADGKHTNRWCAPSGPTRAAARRAQTFLVGCSTRSKDALFISSSANGKREQRHGAG